MSFKDLLRTGASAAWDSLQNKASDMARKNEKAAMYEERFIDLSDEELKRKYNSSSSSLEVKMACHKILKDRGY